MKVTATRSQSGPKRQRTPEFRKQNSNDSAENRNSNRESAPMIHKSTGEKSIIDFEAEIRAKERSEEAMFRSLFVEKSENELLAGFFKWVVHQGWWNQFWATFR